MNTPILFIVFNRPDTTARVFEEIRKAKPSRLYVAADGPRADRQHESALCEDVRRIATAVDWPCEIKTLFREVNLGCGKAVSSAVTWFFDNEEMGIILEDDCLPHVSFFDFCNNLLEYHKDNERIMCVTGVNFLADNNWPHSYYYSIFNHCWGWASWRRAWATYQFDFGNFDSGEAKYILQKNLNIPGFSEFFLKAFNSVRENKIDTWDYQWNWACWRKYGLTCTPRVNLISNIGFGDGATHTISANSRAANKAVFPMDEIISHPSDIFSNQKFDKFVAINHYRVKSRSKLKSFLRTSFKSINNFIK